MHMQSTTVFKNGISTQAVRIPREFRIKSSEVWIEKVGNSLIITPKPTSWDDFFDSSLKLSKDFDMERDLTPPDDRTGFDEL